MNDQLRAQYFFIKEIRIYSQILKQYFWEKKMIVIKLTQYKEQFGISNSCL